MSLSKKSFWISLAYCCFYFLHHKLLHNWNEMDKICHRRKFHDFREQFCWWSQSDGKSLVASMNYVMSLSAHPKMLWELNNKTKLMLFTFLWTLRLNDLAKSITSMAFLLVLCSSLIPLTAAWYRFGCKFIYSFAIKSLSSSC